MSRNAELAHDQDVERSAQRARDLVAHHDAAARQREHDHVGPTRVGAQTLGEHAPGVGSVSEQHRGLASHLPPRLDPR